MKKVLFIASVVKTHIMEFHLPYLKLFHENGWEVSVAARNDYETPEDCSIPFCCHFYDIPFDRSPLSFSNAKAYKRLKQVIDEGQYDIIHCHTPVGSVIGRVAARGARKNGTRVIYTAHGFHFFKGAPLQNWLYYPVERFCSGFTDVLITITKEDHQLAVKHFFPRELVYLPGVGIETTKFSEAVPDAFLRRTLGIGEDEFLLLSAGELNRNKNHQLVIKALAMMKNSSIHYVIAGSGPMESTLRELAEALGIARQVHLLGYRDDLPEIYKCADLLVHPSLREGLPVVVMEAKAAGLPVIASDVRGNADLVPDEYRFAPEDWKRVKTLLELGIRGKIAAIPLDKQYELQKILEQFKEIYGL